MINYNKPVMQLVWDQINRDNPQLKKPLNATNVALLQGPLTNALRDGRNSRIVVNGLQGGGYSGKMDIYYDRLNLSQYFKGVSVPVKVPYRATSYRDIIDRISAACGLVLTADDLTYPDSQFAMITVATGDRTVAIKSDNPAFTGYIPISFIREEPSFADLYHITETGAWEPMDVYSTVYRLDWSMYTQQIINIPMGTPLRLNSNSYMTQFIAALSAWSGIPFTIGNAATDNPYDLYGYVATRNNNPGLDPDMRGEYNYCVKLTPPEDMGNLRRPFFLHFGPKNNVAYLAQEEDVERYARYMSFRETSPNSMSVTLYQNEYVLTRAESPETADDLTGSPYGTRYCTGSIRRLMQHAFPTEEMFQESIANRRRVLYHTAYTTTTSAITYQGLYRNGYQSKQMTSLYSNYCNYFIYYDPSKGGYMVYSPYSKTAPVPWYPAL